MACHESNEIVLLQNDPQIKYHWRCLAHLLLHSLPLLSLSISLSQNITDDSYHVM